MVVKVQNSDQLVGGYNPLDWNRSGWKRTTESFIFNISNRNDTNTAQFSYVINNNYDNAIYCDLSYLPIFGGGHDIYFNTGGYIRRSIIYTYNNINIVHDSKFDELEVFQIIDKN